MLKFGLIKFVFDLKLIADFLFPNFFRYTMRGVEVNTWNEIL
jgi:hypothetical protein